ncbi:uncharacterized protein BDR25DRAFT_347768 [Lindgomyces ingoldianus]|uniref:Uncharacterized protein n=1 Tax=Lindgomyces ingoldianus TaxID=673940 RepID=A0ACB6RGG0_9PLEO|nr:uncharacterized protein BDR25DRAFT_347768 [Lindgomyces ingoldianus]KAF2477397.1 hypothetical protein BDR25DRAFT_347768 [Lindgomyces ingoldianus]
MEVKKDRLTGPESYLALLTPKLRLLLFASDCVSHEALATANEIPAPNGGLVQIYVGEDYSFGLAHARGKLRRSHGYRRAAIKIALVRNAPRPIARKTVLSNDQEILAITAQTSLILQLQQNPNPLPPIHPYAEISLNLYQTPFLNKTQSHQHDPSMAQMPAMSAVPPRMKHPITQDPASRTQIKDPCLGLKLVILILPEASRRAR